MRRVLRIALFAGAGLFGRATGLDLFAQARPPACASPEHRQFDFWIGQWEVTDSAGNVRYGTNEITREEGGCLLHEHWQGSQGGSGQSFNFYEPDTGTWSQVWVASTGNVLRLAGKLEAGSMRLQGGGSSPGALNRITWTREPDGRVRQLWSISSDDGKTWRTSFDGWYRKERAAP